MRRVKRGFEISFSLWARMMASTAIVILLLILNHSTFCEPKIKTHHEWEDFKMHEKWTTLYPFTGTLDFNYILTKTSVSH